MKSLYFLSILLFTIATAHAQLKNTKWKGLMYVPDETSILLDFKEDSVDMIIADEGIVGETMLYSVKDSLITLKKIAGHSPCPAGGEFKLNYSIKGDKLYISNLLDPCYARAQAWPIAPLVRIPQ